MNLNRWQLLKRAEIKFKIIEKWLKSSDQILDIGCGPGAVAFLLKEHSFHVGTIDIQHKSAFDSVTPTIFDGLHLPYHDNAFDVCLILTVLHHAKTPLALLKEAKRVSRGRIIVIEDIYTNSVQLFITKLFDSIVNSEFSGHPHNNKKFEHWIDIFQSLDLDVTESRQRRFLGFFRQADFLLET